jgi:hypothetical protein
VALLITQRSRVQIPPPPPLRQTPLTCVDRGVLRCPGPHARVDVIEPGRPTVTSRYFNSALVGLKDGAEPVPAGDMVAGHEPLTSGAGDWATYIREAVAPSMERLRRARCLGGRPPRGRAPPRVRGALGGTVDLERELASLDGPAMAGYRTLARPAGCSGRGSLRSTRPSSGSGRSMA